LSRRISGAAALLAVTVVACAKPGTATSSRSSRTVSLTVLAASSLTEVFPQIGKAFATSHPGVTFTFSFGGTDSLTAQIVQGAPADVFAGASPKYGDQLASQGEIEPWRAFCTNKLVLVLPASNPAEIGSLRDLARPGVKLVVGAETVPAGSYTRTVLANLDAVYGAGYSTKVLANVVSKEGNVEGVLTKVRLGEADAGFVYVTDRKAAGSSVSAIGLPDAAQAVATYPIAVVESSSNVAVARQFVDFVLGSAAQDLLRRGGFGPPPAS
jgi:molybdate transport system substrate-binding protein